MNKETINDISYFGFRFEKGSAHTARTMMLEDLQLLLSYVSSPDADKSDFLKAIEEDNCLGKRSGINRKLTGMHLIHLYSLDPSITVFRLLLYFWNRDVDGRPLLALLCAYARDPILRMSAPCILNFTEGSIVSRIALEKYIDDKEPGRFSKATLESTAINLNSTWTKSGQLPDLFHMRCSSDIWQEFVEKRCSCLLPVAVSFLTFLMIWQ